MIYIAIAFKRNMQFSSSFCPSVYRSDNSMKLLDILSKTVNIVKAGRVYSPGYSLDVMLAARESQLLAWDYKRMVICGKVLGYSGEYCPLGGSKAPRVFGLGTP